ncbi:ribonuclease [Clostridia bacterium]|nr:ribonuclease [Clostridia bacterium]
MKNKDKSDEYLLVDGYNIIFAWEELARLVANESLEAARNSLIAVLSNYQGLCALNIIVVFDAYRVKNGTEKIELVNNVSVVYTREKETADNFIERTAGTLYRRAYNVCVATSDIVEQTIILGKGATKIPAETLLTRIEDAKHKMKKSIAPEKYQKRNALYDSLDPETQKIWEDMRRGNT